MSPPPGAGMNLSDIYYVLFRRKWLILFFSVLGVAAAVGIFLKMSPPYVSEAKLMVKYVTDSAQPAPVGPGADTVRQVDARGEGIIISEAEMLSSADVAKEVAQTLGAKKILGAGATETNTMAVAAVLMKNLRVDPPKRGNVLRVTYQNSDPTVVQPVLEEIIKTYFIKHRKVHQDMGDFDQYFQSRTESLRAQLSTAEDELRKAKAKANIISLDETKKFFSEQRAKLNNEISQATADLAGRQAALQEWRRLKPESLLTPEEAAAASAALSNQTAAATTTAALPPADKISEYQRVLDRVNFYKNKKQDLKVFLTDESPLVKEVDNSLGQLDAQKKALETEFPVLKQQQQSVVVRSNERPIERGPDLASELVRVKELTAILKERASQLTQLNKQIEEVDAIESSIVEWEQKKAEASDRIKVYSASLEQHRLNEAVAAGTLSNIKPIQEPSAPARDMSKLYKMMAIAGGGGIGFGLALAFILEMVLNQTVRRPAEITNKFRLPVFINIPEFKRFGRRRSVKALTNGATIVDTDANGAPVANGDGGAAVNGNMALAKRMPELPPWDEKHDLYPFSEALRDRLVTFFEIKGMTHKPKLIAMTSCGHGAGVTTTAAGLAASLSETGEGNVLLVDMNLEQGSAHPFYRGKPACGLEELLIGDDKKGKREEAMVQDKLFVVSGTDGDKRLPKILPKRFTHLLPKLQASDYDYIIFDMPPMSQTSVTPRLAALMDVVLMVVESGKTHRDALAHANAMLQETKTNVGVVFNRQRNYVPRALQQEL